MLPLSLLVLGQGFGYPPPPPPGSACSYTPPEDPTITYDLSAIMALGTLPPISASSGTNSQFFVAVCQSVTRKCSSQECSTCDVSDPSGVDTWSAPGQSCAAIGSESTKKWVLQKPGNAAGGVMLHYEGGDQQMGSGPRRSSTIVFACDPSVEHAVGRGAVENPPLRYTITIASKHACARMPQPLSWGWWFIILGFVGSVGYLGGGIAYNVRVRGEEGLDVIPNWKHWQMLPALVYDGLVFSWMHGRTFAYNAPRELQEWWGGRNTKELRAPIAAAVE